MLRLFNLLPLKQMVCATGVFLFHTMAMAQTPLFSETLVSDVGTSNNIGDANTSRNVSVTRNGDIYVAYSGTAGIRVAKSTDRGNSFLPSVQVTTRNAEVDLIVNDDGFVFVVWTEDGRIMFSRSTDNGSSFIPPRDIGEGTFDAPHMAVFLNNVYIVDRVGLYTYSNDNNGAGEFTQVVMPMSYVFADIRTDLDGVFSFLQMIRNCICMKARIPGRAIPG